MENHPIILKPLISEKSMIETKYNRFAFLVAEKSNKREIKKAVEELFKVNVLSVKTIILKGKTKKVGKKRQEITIAKRKKAIVELKEGQKIDLFETGGQS